jgi:L-rhamnose isomerase
VTKDKLEPKHFVKWVEFAKAHNIKLDFNPTCFSDPMVVDNLTLSSPKPEVQRFWINHCKACRRIGEYFGRELGSTCLVNIWISDGFKDIPGDRLGPRLRLKQALDEIFSEKLDSRFVIDSVESKVFGIGLESMTVGSHEFYLNYAARNNVLCLLDNGHFHPTETISDKISSMLAFSEKLALHISRPVRWDSDHVVLFDDETRAIAIEIARYNALERVLLALDFFDASINRIAAWVTGVRNLQKSLLYGLLLPHDQLRKCQDEANFTKLLVLNEEIKTYPFGAVWDEFCVRNKVPVRQAWFDVVEKYEREVLSLRK